MLWNKFVHKGPIFEQYIYGEKEGWGQQTCDQLEGVKPIYSFLTFQNGEFTVAENFLAKKRVHVQTIPQGHIFMCPLSQDDRKRVMLRWEGALYQFLCLSFGLPAAPYVFTKLLKILMALLRRIGIRIVIYLDDNVDYWQNKGRDYSFTR